MTATVLSPESLEQRIDRLGQIKAQIAALQAQETELKNGLVEEVGIGAVEGTLFRVSVSVSQRETLDMEAVRRHLSPQFIRAHTKSADVTTVRVTARKGA